MKGEGAKGCRERDQGRGDHWEWEEGNRCIRLGYKGLQESGIEPRSQRVSPKATWGFFQAIDTLYPIPYTLNPNPKP
jgi:hypothetical protein